MKIYVLLFTSALLTLSPTLLPIKANGCLFASRGADYLRRRNKKLKLLEKLEKFCPERYPTSRPNPKLREEIEELTSQLATLNKAQSYSHLQRFLQKKQIFYTQIRDIFLKKFLSSRDSELSAQALIYLKVEDSHLCPLVKKFLSAEFHKERELTLRVLNTANLRAAFHRMPQKFYELITKYAEDELKYLLKNPYILAQNTELLRFIIKIHRPSEHLLFHQLLEKPERKLRELYVESEIESPPTAWREDCLEKLLIAAGDEEPLVRIPAVRVLAQRRPSKLTEAAEKLLRRDPRERFPTFSPTNLKISILKIASILKSDFTTSAPNAHSFIRRALRSRNPSVREEALLALQKMGAYTYHYLPEILELLGDPHKDVRRMALWTLVRIRPPLPVDMLSEFLELSGKRARELTFASSRLGDFKRDILELVGLTKIRHWRVFRVVLRLLQKSPNWKVRREAAWVLCRIGPKAAKEFSKAQKKIIASTLINVLQDRQWHVKYCALQFLGWMGPEVREFEGWYGRVKISVDKLFKKMLKEDRDPYIKRVISQILNSGPSPKNE